MKSDRVAGLLVVREGSTFPAQYDSYFEQFNRGRFYEAHDVLEDLWLQDRTGPEGAFYKGLIQLAGAFVHVRKGRPQPATALLRLAERSLTPYAPLHVGLDLEAVQRLIGYWLALLGNQPPGSDIFAHIPLPALPTPAVRIVPKLELADASDQTPPQDAARQPSTDAGAQTIRGRHA